MQFAEQLGYSIGPEEWSQEPDRWGLNRFPPRYLGLLRRALTSGLMSIRGAAAVTDMAEEDLEELISGPPPSTLDEEEFSYLAQSG
ncbi:MAG TPA: hypothetical protein VHA57_00195 [Actinomycetota bacterium]|nr:hypothetical protein [Actinomycetota bacterium]